AELEKDELFLNLASKEYFKSVKTDKLKVPVITPIFKDFKNGKLKIISFFAKKARGAMVRYILDKNVETLNDLKGFDYDDYRFSEQYSNPEKNEFVFVR
ncbi:MAG: peroxide stress protein YaaA, partial [Leeuwenhoekiella sp.]